MEWMNRAGRPNQNPGQTVAPTTNAAAATAAHHTAHGRARKAGSFSFHNVTSVILLFSLTLLTLAVIGLIMMYKQSDEGRYVAKDRMQAVFLSGGQVYFGKIRALNNKYVGMNDIYYLRVNQQVQPKQGENAKQDISLVKLGCELHGPQDQMLINREQVIFWENLKDDGQVGKAVAEYKKANPNGQKCDANTGNNGGASTTPATTPAANAPSTNNTTTNP
ncbi:MAG TPA: hypothetical protein VK674_04900 [Candidatus Limnocylindria bacterium]|nr:hypothetical protein [Candidatus Limnocylindria bacterium]